MSRTYKKEYCKLCKCEYNRNNTTQHRRTKRHRKNCLTFAKVNDEQLKIYARNNPIGIITLTATNILKDIDLETEELYSLFCDILMEKYCKVFQCARVGIVCEPDNKWWYQNLGFNATKEEDGIVYMMLEGPKKSYV